MPGSLSLCSLRASGTEDRWALTAEAQGASLSIVCFHLTGGKCEGGEYALNLLYVRHDLTGMNFILFCVLINKY